MTIILRSPSRRRVLGYGAAGVAALGLPSIARAQAQVVRIGLPTKTYYPTIIAETALRQKLFEAAGQNFNRGQRAFFFALGYLGWFAGPWALIASTAAVVAVLWRRQFRSPAQRALMIDPPVPEKAPSSSP